MRKERQETGMVSKDLLSRKKGKKEIHRQWKKGQVSWAEYKDAAKLCRVVVRMANVCLELSLARYIKSNKKGFCRYVMQKRKIKGQVLLTHLRERMSSRCSWTGSRSGPM